jgi:hypothetical protein
LYLERFIEYPIKCNECGAEYVPDSKSCVGCKRYFLQVRKYTAPKQNYKEATVLRSMRDATIDSEYLDLCKKGLKADDTAMACNAYWPEYAEPISFTDKNGKIHKVPKLYYIYRKPVGMCGNYVGFRVNGQITYPDMSTPIRVDRLPRDSKPLTEEESRQYWFN